MLHTSLHLLRCSVSGSLWLKVFVDVRNNFTNTIKDNNKEIIKMQTRLISILQLQKSICLRYKTSYNSKVKGN